MKINFKKLLTVSLALLGITAMSGLYCNTAEENAFLNAFKSRNYEVMENLLQKKPELINTQVVDRYQRSNGTVDEYPYSLLDKARGFEMYKFLLLKGANPWISMYSSDIYAKQYYAAYGDSGTRENPNHLPELNAKINATIEVLFIFAEQGNLSGIAKLLEDPTELAYLSTSINNQGQLTLGRFNSNLFTVILSAKNAQGQTPQQVAAAHGHTEVARILGLPPQAMKAAFKLEKAKVSPENLAQQLLDRTKAGDYLNMLTLIKQGADVNATDSEGKSLLHLAIEYERDNAALTLMGNGAHVNAKDKNNETPLHYLARTQPTREDVKNGLIVVAKELINKYGADPAAKNNSGETPAQIARSMGNTEIAGVIEAAQSK